MWDKPPLSMPDSYAIDVRNLAGLREWYKQKLGLQEANTDREDDSGRPFVDLYISNGDTFLSLVELPSGANADKPHVILYAKQLERAHKWLIRR
jgi:catechol-2,3-dioxygenase